MHIRTVALVSFPSLYCIVLSSSAFFTSYFLFWALFKFDFSMLLLKRVKLVLNMNGEGSWNSTEKSPKIDFDGKRKNAYLLSYSLTSSLLCMETVPSFRKQISSKTCPGCTMHSLSGKIFEYRFMTMLLM